MNPRLFVIAGPLEGAFFALPEQPVGIGREASNLLAVDDDSLAAHHCEVAPWDGQYRVRALGGPVFVNGLPVRERVLGHGDELRAGASLFLFLVYDADTLPPVVPESALNHDLIGDSSRMQAVQQLLAKVAPSDSTVLICGESGTGKELAARAIHLNSPRAAGPFVAINCAALTETLLESEMFGHERGAFTGAVAQKQGKLETADGGTLFLDEVAELAPVLQAKLLRVLQEHEFERVGGTRTIKVDMRLLAATNKDLPEAVRRGLFRADLYYRLNVVSLTMPALRERREDIPVLATWFAGRYGKRVLPEACAALARYDWPGNVRELENAIEHAVVLGAGKVIRPEDLPDTVTRGPARLPQGATSYEESLQQTKRQVILEAMAAAGGNFTEAARRLCLHPNYLHRLIRNLNLRDELKASGRDTAGAV